MPEFIKKPRNATWKKLVEASRFLYILSLAQAQQSGDYFEATVELFIKLAERRKALGQPKLIIFFVETSGLYEILVRRCLTKHCNPNHSFFPAIAEMVAKSMFDQWKEKNNGSNQKLLARLEQDPNIELHSLNWRTLITDSPLKEKYEADLLTIKHFIQREKLELALHTMRNTMSQGKLDPTAALENLISAIHNTENLLREKLDPVLRTIETHDAEPSTQWLITLLKTVKDILREDELERVIDTIDNAKTTMEPLRSEFESVRQAITNAKGNTRIFSKEEFNPTLERFKNLIGRTQGTLKKSLEIALHHLQAIIRKEILETVLDTTRHIKTKVEFEQVLPTIGKTTQEIESKKLKRGVADALLIIKQSTDQEQFQIGLHTLQTALVEAIPSRGLRLVNDTLEHIFKKVYPKLTVEYSRKKLRLDDPAISDQERWEDLTEFLCCETSLTKAFAENGVPVRKADGTWKFIKFTGSDMQLYPGRNDTMAFLEKTVLDANPIPWGHIEFTSKERDIKAVDVLDAEIKKTAPPQLKTSSTMWTSPPAVKPRQTDPAPSSPFVFPEAMEEMQAMLLHSEQLQQRLTKLSRLFPFSMQGADGHQSAHSHLGIAATPCGYS